ncbi:MAG: hypothetical protein KAJ08_15005, partial [Deltaproteobacteria bacterium]|nr:hypothetical protein [Deltaproteobacteria bacterium]
LDDANVQFRKTTMSALKKADLITKNRLKEFDNISKERIAQIDQMSANLMQKQELRQDHKFTMTTHAGCIV